MRGTDRRAPSAGSAAASGAATLLDLDPRVVWRKYCGFLDLSLRDFQDIQEQLLLEQIDLIHTSPLGRRLLRGKAPDDLTQFRATVPLTTYSDYVPFLSPGSDNVLNQKPLIWSHTTGAQADFKWVPYTQRGLERLLDNLMAAFILAAASRPGEVRVWPGDTVLHNTPERPYLSGLAAFGMTSRFGFRCVLDPAVSERLDFKERVRQGFQQALGKKLDVIISMTSVLVKVGEGFAAEARTMSSRPRRLLNPRALCRVVNAYTRSKLRGGPVLPKDLWPAKAIIGWGVDTPFFRDQVRHYWGRTPFEVYACTEGGIMGMQSWEKEGLAFNPYADFYEFIPLAESLRSREDQRYHPRTVLLSEVEPGETYELVITNFYGMALVRYRVGHLVRFLARAERHDPDRLPQFSFLGRADDRIDLAGFTRLDEKTVWEALGLTGLAYEGWTVRKEFHGDVPQLHMYIELRRDYPEGLAEDSLHQRLKEVDPFYKDLETVLGMHPLRVIRLRNGAFDRFYERRLKAGNELGKLTPPRMNASDEDIADLLSNDPVPVARETDGA